MTIPVHGNRAVRTYYFGIDDKAKSEATQWRGSGDKTAWAMALWLKRTVARLVPVRENGEYVRGIQSKVLAGIAQYAGLSRSTVIQRHQLARTYDGTGLVEEYTSVEGGTGVLTLGIMREAMHVKASTKEEKLSTIMNLLDRAITSADKYNGIPAPPTVVRAWVIEANREYNGLPAYTDEYHVERAIGALRRAQAVSKNDDLIEAAEQAINVLVDAIVKEAK